MHTLKERLKNIPSLRRFVKKWKIRSEYFKDSEDFLSHYLEIQEKHHHSEYRVLLLVHNLEKGMCIRDARPFGQKKALRIKSILEQEEISEFTSELALSVLSAWVAYYREMNWKDADMEQISEFLSGKTIHSETGGSEIVSREQFTEKADNFKDLITARRSVREFSSKALTEEDVRYAAECFIQAPSACNRQMCRVCLVKDEKHRDLLFKELYGANGIDRDNAHLFLVTYDLAAFDFYGERSQGYLNAGLAAMNFVNALHERGIGSCFLQWGNTHNEDRKVRELLGLMESERIAVVIAAGYYPEYTRIPKSARHTAEEIYREL